MENTSAGSEDSVQNTDVLEMQLSPATKLCGGPDVSQGFTSSSLSNSATEIAVENFSREASGLRRRRTISHISHDTYQPLIVAQEQSRDDLGLIASLYAQSPSIRDSCLGDLSSELDLAVERPRFSSKSPICSSESVEQEQRKSPTPRNGYIGLSEVNTELRSPHIISPMPERPISTHGGNSHFSILRSSQNSLHQLATDGRVDGDTSGIEEVAIFQSHSAFDDVSVSKGQQLLSNSSKVNYPLNVYPAEESPQHRLNTSWPSYGPPDRNWSDQASLTLSTTSPIHANNVSHSRLMKHLPNLPDGVNVEYPAKNLNSTMAARTNPALAIVAHSPLSARKAARVNDETVGHRKFYSLAYDDDTHRAPSPSRPWTVNENYPWHDGLQTFDMDFLPPASISNLLEMQQPPEFRFQITRPSTSTMATTLKHQQLITSLESPNLIENAAAKSEEKLRGTARRLKIFHSLQRRFKSQDIKSDEESRIVDFSSKKWPCEQEVIEPHSVSMKPVKIP